MVVDGNGVIHVIWVDAFDGYKYSQSTDGLTWTSPVTVKFPFSPDAPSPVMFSDANGLIHIFWLGNQNKLSYSQTLPDNLDTPPAWRTKSDLDNSVFDFDAGVDAQGGVHVAYVKNPVPGTGTAGAFYRKSSDGGRTWAPANLLYESPYFRSINAEKARIRMTVADGPGEERLYIVWDDRPQKRIFLATSADGGLNWAPIKEMVGPDSKLGFRTPYNADIDVLEDKVLATWFVGETGARCTPYSWSSSDEGETWSEQLPILPKSTQCPEKGNFVSIDPDYLIELFMIQGDLYFSAWNGEGWSRPEVQTGPESITNPATFETVSLGCEQIISYNDRLLVVGCDEGTGKDIWFLERELESFKALFPQPSQWGDVENVINTPQVVSSLASITDGAGNIHAVWIQSPQSLTDTSAPVIQYARSDGIEWTRSVPVITDLEGVPPGLSLGIDSQQRLLLTWVDQLTGQLKFSWSNSERATIPLEWAQPVVVSASSTLTNSPSMLVDARDRIVIAYAITLNEERGIYITQSIDQGETWSTPVRVFDAVTEEWEMVDQPKLAVTGDGTLHILFTKYSLFEEPQPVGLYYSQSKDGGINWTPAEIVSEQPGQWSELVAYQGTLHRLWQEKNKNVTRTNHQTSTDSGVTWNAPDRIPNDTAINSEPAVSVDGVGKLHFTQVTGQESQIFEEWVWSEDRWQMLEASKVAAFELNSPPAIVNGVTSGGRMYAILRFEKLLNKEIETDIWSISRLLELTEPTTPSLAAISTPSAPSSSGLEPTPDLQPTPIPTSPLQGMSDPQPRLNKNVIGIALVIAVSLLILVFLIPKRDKAHNKTTNNKV